MQNSTSDNDNIHIITASNANKKLFFQGWKKSVEAFSQGKGSLSHRCTSILSQLDTSHLDAAISWSSSDEEKDNSNSQRFRPIRTLASQINFDDCKRVRRRGRRHSSAQFVRSVEKHFRFEEIKRNEVLCSQVSESNNFPDNSHPQDLLTNAPDSFEDSNWINNLSILNKRINISENTTSCLSSESLIDNAKILSPRKGSQENEATSPILTSGKSKKFRRKKMCISNKEMKVNVENSSRQTPSELPPCSPVFKITSHRRRNCHKIPQESSVRSKRQSDISICVPSGAPCSSSSNANYLASKCANVVPTSKLEKACDSPISPVLGKSLGKRRRPMVVDKLISPILGSKTKRSRPLKIQKSIPESHLSCSVMESSDHFNSYLQDSVCNISPNTDINSEMPPKISKSETLATAKRSLDFSVQSSKSKNQTINCDIKNNQSAATTLKYSHIDCEKGASDLENAVTGNLGPPEFDCSHLIEEINTEQIEFACVPQPIRTPAHIQKRKKLSLSKKPDCKQTTTTKSIESIELPIKCTKMVEKQAFSETVEDQPFNIKLVDLPEDRSNQAFRKENTFDYIKPARSSTNCTLLIEEENSEPIEFVSQDVFKQNQDLSGNLNLLLRNSDKVQENSDDIEHGEIDSCSSQSPENSQLTQIEKLPSSCVSSPVTISQTSSPMAPTVFSGLSAETDDFNAPPKKGKKKLKTDGLASRLQRVLNRHRSSSRIWQFKQSKDGRARTTSVNKTRTTSMALSVHHTWIEYSHVIIQGCVKTDMSTGNLSSCLNSLSKHVVLVLDPYIADKIGKIMSAKMIRVFPPWQAVKLRDISLILCAYCIEVIEVDSAEPVGNICLSEKTISTPEEGLECFVGISLPDIIFPQIVEKPTCIFQCTEATDEVDEGVEGVANFCTISALVTNYYVGTATCDSLNVKILKAFQFRQSESDQSSIDCPSWSLLGQDTKGEMCEVMLGSEQSNTSGSIWPNVKAGHIIGHVTTFTGFVPVQRISPFRVSKLWRVVSNICAEPCEQPVFYVLAASSSNWECKILDFEKKLENIQMRFTPLSRIMVEKTAPSIESTRINIICRPLHVTDERLYVTDSEVSPSITVISVNPTAFLAPEVFKAPVLVILDLEVDSGGLSVDKYSRISFLGAEDFSLVKDYYNAEPYQCLADLKPPLPYLQKCSTSKSLAIFTGTISGVDEDSAYMWPACGICDNELLSLGDSSENYRCQKCNDQCNNFVLRMSLQVLCCCPNLPPCASVRLKLLQRTIEKLLPPALVGDEGYDMNSVLGQNLGPLRCEIISVKDQNFTLQELPNLP